MTAWKREDWNTVRIRVDGRRAARDGLDQRPADQRRHRHRNHAVDGMVEGPVAIQIHGGAVRWQPGGFWRWRNLAIRELPADAK